MQPPDDSRAEDPFSGSRAAHPVIQPISPQLLEQQRISPTTSPVPSAAAAAAGAVPGTLPVVSGQLSGYPAFHPNPAVRDEAMLALSPEQLAYAAALAQHQQSIASGKMHFLKCIFLPAVFLSARKSNSQVFLLTYNAICSRC